MQTNSLKQKVKKTLSILLIFSVLVPISVPIMVFALVGGNWFLAAPCITILVCGFYGLPIGWVAWVSLKEHSNILRGISEDKILNIAELATTYGKKTNHVKKIITSLISKRHLTGYKLNNEGTSLIEVFKPKEQTAEIKKQKGKCEYCAAPLEPNAKICKHCGCAV